MAHFVFLLTRIALTCRMAIAGGGMIAFFLTHLLLMWAERLPACEGFLSVHMPFLLDEATSWFFLIVSTALTYREIAHWAKVVVRNVKRAFVELNGR